MVSLQEDIIDVPSAVATVLTDRTGSSYQRTLVLRNLTSVELTYQLQYSADGTTWTNLGTAVTLGVAGGGSDVEIENITNTNILRVRAQGGGEDRDMQVSLMRVLDDSDKVWTRPVL